MTLERNTSEVEEVFAWRSGSRDALCTRAGGLRRCDHGQRRSGSYGARAGRRFGIVRRCQLPRVYGVGVGMMLLGGAN